MLGSSATLHAPRVVFRWLPRACIIVDGLEDQFRTPAMSGVDLSTDARFFTFIGTDENRCPGSLGQRPFET